MVSAVTLLPLPDSPTMPRTSPGCSENDTSSTALISPRSVANAVVRSRDFKQAHCWMRSLGSSTSRKPSPSRLRPSTVTISAGTGDRDDPGGIDHVLPALGHDVAPGGRGRHRAEAEEGERRLRQHRVGEQEAELHDQRRHRVRHDVAAQDAPVPGAGGDRGLHVFHLPQHDHGRAHDACGARDIDDREGDDHVGDRGPRMAVTPIASRIAGKAISASLMRISTLSTRRK